LDLPLSDKLLSDLREHMKKLKETYPELLNRYNTSAILGRCGMAKDPAFPKGTVLSAIRKADIQSYGPLILKDQIALNTGLKDALLAKFPEGLKKLLEFSSSLVFDQNNIEKMSASSNGPLLEELTEELNPKRCQGFFSVFGKGQKTKSDILVAPESMELSILMSGKTLMPIFASDDLNDCPGLISKGKSARVSKNVLPPLMLMDEEPFDILRLEELLRDFGDIRLIFRYPYGAKALTRALGLKDTPIFQNILKNGFLSRSTTMKVKGFELGVHFYYQSPQNPWKEGAPFTGGHPETFPGIGQKVLLTLDPYEEPLQLSQIYSSIFLENSMKVLEKRLEAVMAVEGDVLNFKSDFVIFLASVFAQHFHLCLGTVPFHSEVPMGRLKDDIRKFTRFIISGKELYSQVKGTLRYVFTALGISKEKLELLDEGIDPFEHNSSTSDDLKVLD
jgi:hypothetical protein